MKRQERSELGTPHRGRLVKTVSQPAGGRCPVEEVGAARALGIHEKRCQYKKKLIRRYYLSIFCKVTHTSPLKFSLVGQSALWFTTEEEGY